NMFVFMVLSSFLVLAWFRQSNYSQTYFQYTFSLVSSDAFYLRKVSKLNQLFARVCELTYGRQLTRQEIYKLTEGKSLVSQ
ncbi:hypothetical protein, partial [Microcystis sp. M158S2]|uniref:hypothetical protein n=1 Tax=Microcystis sp. M158S2 TaxID=2771152 RepID=UPI00258A14A9